MNRILKFRAWDLESKIMWCHEELVAADPDGVMSFNSIIGGQSHGLVAMQFVGLYDKNGKEVYEGDILAWPGSRTEWRTDEEDGDYEVFVPYTAIGMVEWGGPCQGYKNIGHYRCDGVYLAEVIGNIYENPELLESP